MEKKNNPTTTTVREELDAYCVVAHSLDELTAEIAKMEDHSRWIPGISTPSIKANPIASPVEAKIVADTTGLDYDLVTDTTTNLYLTGIQGDKPRLLRDCGLGTLYSRACLFGSALGRMDPESLAEVLNKALAVSKGSTLVLERYGKVAATHSDEGYCVMPISELLGITERVLKTRFGKPIFVEGYNSHSFTRASFILPDVQKKLCAQYAEAAKKSHLAMELMENWIPSVRLMSSDTADCSAILLPVFQTRTGAFIRLQSAKKVRHSRNKSGNEGLVKFEDEAASLYGLFEASAEAVKALNDIAIYNASNVVVGLCNKFRIPKKYGDKARETVEQFAVSTPVLTAFDVYLAMSEAVAAASAEQKSITAVDISDQLATTMAPGFDWKALDVGGVVAWGKEVA